MAEHSNGNVWILKAPYVQNAQRFRVQTIKDIEGLKVHLACILHVFEKMPPEV